MQQNGLNCKMLGSINVFKVDPGNEFRKLEIDVLPPLDHLSYAMGASGT